MKIGRPLRTVVNTEPPLTADEVVAARRAAVDRFLDGIRQRKKDLFEEVVAECKSDPRFLERLLKELKPLRGKGGMKRPTWADGFIAHQAAIGDVPPPQIIETIARTLRLSEPQARRLYYAARKTQKSGKRERSA